MNFKNRQKEVRATVTVKRNGEEKQFTPMVNGGERGLMEELSSQGLRVYDKEMEKASWYLPHEIVNVEFEFGAERPKLLIIGHGRHGKDTVGEMLRDQYGYKFTSSSLFCLHETIWDNWGCVVYDTPEECYADRANHRTLWAQMISAYNIPDRTKTAATMLSRGYDMYVGMRKRAELEACKEAGVFDHIVWVDALDRLPPEPIESMELVKEDADFVIDNNGDLTDLKANVAKFVGNVLENRA